jgi:VIT1/CCC1 family predicted Fe2+/Mn2+ transporter
VRHVLAALKVRGLSVYDAGRSASGHLMPTSVAQVGARHKGYGGGNLRAAVFGVNDGLVSNASLIMGVAGANVGADAIVTSGIAGLLAGALSMAAGEYISMRTQREMFEYQIGLERDELNEYPDEEAEELALIYHARGMDLDQARSVSRDLVKNPAAALDALAREELGLNPDDLGSPLGAAVFSFGSFALGALLPLLPFFVAPRVVNPVVLSGIVTAIALFGVGAALSLFTGRGALRGGFRMVLTGAGAGLVTWLIGARSARRFPASSRRRARIERDSLFICSNSCRRAGIGRHHDPEQHVLVAGRRTGQPRPRPELLARARAGGQLHFDRPAERGHGYRLAERRLPRRDG